MEMEILASHQDTVSPQIFKFFKFKLSKTFNRNNMFTINF